MKHFLLFIKFCLGNSFGMADLNDDFLAKQSTTPKTKIDPSDFNTRVKCLPIKALVDRLFLVNEEILGLNLPEGAKVLDAQLNIPASTGAGGIFELGHKAYTDKDGNAVAEDPNAFIESADSGGQSVLERANNTAKLGDNLGKVGPAGAQIFIKCTEATTTTDVTPVTIEGYVYYALES